MGNGDLQAINPHTNALACVLLPLVLFNPRIVFSGPPWGLPQVKGQCPCGESLPRRVYDPQDALAGALPEARSQGSPNVHDQSTRW